MESLQNPLVVKNTHGTPVIPSVYIMAIHHANDQFRIIYIVHLHRCWKVRNHATQKKEEVTEPATSTKVMPRHRNDHPYSPPETSTTQ